MRNYFSSYYDNWRDLVNDPRFYINEISPTRKEVRLYARTGINEDIIKKILLHDQAE